MNPISRSRSLAGTVAALLLAGCATSSPSTGADPKLQRIADCIERRCQQIKINEALQDSRGSIGIVWD